MKRLPQVKIRRRKSKGRNVLPLRLENKFQEVSKKLEEVRVQLLYFSLENVFMTTTFRVKNT